jgi:SAM-dependent methyltransferase
MSTPTPELILKTIAGFHAGKCLFVADKLGIFEALRDGPASLAGLSRQLAIPERTLRIMADALVTLGFLSHVSEGYANSPTAAAFLAGGPGPDMRPVLQMWDGVVYKQWAYLEDSIRKDRQMYGYQDFTPEEQVLFSRGVSALTMGSARALATNYDFSNHRSMLDLGGGTGSFVLAARQQNPALAVSLFELAKTAAAVRAELARTPGGADVKIVEGDFFVDPIPQGHDVFLFANVTHLLLPENNIKLLRRVREAAAPGARVLLVDFWMNPARTEPPFAALLAAEFQIVSGQGDVYSVEMGFSWLTEAGFRPVMHQPFGGPASLIVGEAV